MSDFVRSSGIGQALDPLKRVNYTLGLVLGEDEFEKEQHYLRARDHLGVRALHGYGTVSGLTVNWNSGTGQVEVAAGLAVDPVGRFVCVPADQCADLAPWIVSHQEEIAESASPPVDSFPGGLSLYVVLCYRECETDTVPIPSEDCRSDEESMAASRIADSFELRLSLHPPQPAGEVAGPGLAATIEQLLAFVESPPSASFPSSDAIRDELIAWATEVRPEAALNACLSAPAENCDERPADPSTGVLLARLDLDIDQDPSGNLSVVADPTVEYEDRPVLLSTRFLQEWLTQLMEHPDVLLGLEDLALGDLSDVDTSGQAVNDVLTFNGSEWVPAAPAVGIDDHNALNNLATGDDHTQYLPVDGSRPMIGDFDAGNNRLTNLAGSTSPADAMRQDQILGGDLAPDPAGLRLRELQGIPVQAVGPNAPAAGDALVFTGAFWEPAPIAGSSPTAVGLVLPFVTIEMMGRIGPELATSVFALWFNVDAPANGVAVVPRDGPNAGPADVAMLQREEVTVLNEQCRSPVDPVATPVRRNLVRVAPTGICNIFRAEITRQIAPYLRFTFNLELIQMSTGQTALEYTQDRGITWEGQDGRETVTKFVMNPSALEPTAGFEEEMALPTRNGGDLFGLRG
jgi:hypothetical protein